LAGELDIGIVDSTGSEGEGRYVAWVTAAERHFYRDVGFARFSE